MGLRAVLGGAALGRERRGEVGLCGAEVRGCSGLEELRGAGPSVGVRSGPAQLGGMETSNAAFRRLRGMPSAFKREPVEETAVCAGGAAPAVPLVSGGLFSPFTASV